MRFKRNSIIVRDQESGLRFYTEVLGFVKKMDIPLTAFIVGDVGKVFEIRICQTPSVGPSEE